MHIDLSGRTAIITGSSQGIGLAIAVGLAQAGARTVLTGRDEERLAQARQRITDEVPAAQAIAVSCDLGTEEGAGELRTEVPEADILVNNLGIFAPADPLEITDEQWRAYFDTNVLTAVRLIRAYLPGMRQRGWGRIQNIASDSALVIPAEMIHYGMSKTALLAVSRGYAKAAAGTGVTVNSVIAGPTHTPGVEDFVYDLVGRDRSWDEAQREFMRLHRPQSLLGRLIEPAEIAHLVVYLSSEQASATTGAAVRVDGGYVDSIVP
ncbi:SDR family NAD(P)-dependent oxidoreductase [Streptomyces sp. NPDC091376]|uniref:SDR family NAD(P)-dependent oxidoreductase n=1 Tax=Streptomyces sp. NPDC091376 TaxID=3365994 RepID=UPI00380E6470